MHIGIDLDNTILDATETHLRYFNLASGASFTAADLDGFYMYKLYGWTWEEREDVFRRYGHRIFDESVPYPLAVETLRALAERHRIAFVTARTEPYRAVTAEWLKRHGIEYDDLVFAEDKLQACDDLRIDVLIDDAPHYAEQFAKQNKPYILYDQPYNRHVPDCAYVRRAADWREVREHLESLRRRPLR